MCPWKLRIITFYQDQHDNTKHCEQLIGRCFEETLHIVSFWLVTTRGKTFHWWLIGQCNFPPEWLPGTDTHIVWFWQEPPLYSKCVNVSFFLLLNGILWGLMGSCRAGMVVQHSVPRISHMWQAVRSPLIRRHTAEKANPQQQKHIQKISLMIYYYFLLSINLYTNICSDALITLSTSASSHVTYWSGSNSTSWQEVVRCQNSITEEIGH